MRLNKFCAPFLCLSLPMQKSVQTNCVNAATAHRSHDVRQCEPSSARAFTDALTLVTVGNYVAWPTAVDYYDGPRLYWQFIPPSREGPAGEAKMVPLEKFFRYGSFPTTVDNVAMNRDGILLFRVHAISRVFYPFSGSR